MQYKTLHSDFSGVRIFFEFFLRVLSGIPESTSKSCISPVTVALVLPRKVDRRIHHILHDFNSLVKLTLGNPKFLGQFDWPSCRPGTYKIINTLNPPDLIN